MSRMTIAEYRRITGQDASEPAMKYHNKRTEYDGVWYDSKKEAEYAKHLDSLKHAAKRSERVYSWERQIPIEIVVNGMKICKYVADFLVNYEDGRQEYVDVKGVRTPIYKLKKKLVLAVRDIDIKEV